jgi:hypothetical protein
VDSLAPRSLCVCSAWHLPQHLPNSSSSPLDRCPRHSNVQHAESAYSLRFRDTQAGTGDPVISRVVPPHLPRPHCVRNSSTHSMADHTHPRARTAEKNRPRSERGKPGEHKSIKTEIRAREHKSIETEIKAREHKSIETEPSSSLACCQKPSRHVSAFCHDDVIENEEVFRAKWANLPKNT